MGAERCIRDSLGDGFTVNTVGFKTKKAAVAVVEEAGWTVVDEFKVG